MRYVEPTGRVASPLHPLIQELLRTADVAAHVRPLLVPAEFAIHDDHALTLQLIADRVRPGKITLEARNLFV